MHKVSGGVFQVFYLGSRGWTPFGDGFASFAEAKKFAKMLIREEERETHGPDPSFKTRVWHFEVGQRGVLSLELRVGDSSR